MKIVFLAMAIFGEAALSPLLANMPLIDEIVTRDKAAMLATLGKSVVGRDAENIIIAAAAQMKANGGKPVPLVAKGWNCIAAAHAYVAEPQLFSEVRFSAPPPSWTDLVRNPDPTHDSYAIAVWGALKDYDWPDLIH